jgi:hypothetical protein
MSKQSVTRTCALARPMPLFPPVMTAIFPSFFMIFLLVILGFNFELNKIIMLRHFSSLSPYAHGAAL